MLRAQRIELPEWGGYAFVRELTGIERAEYEDMLAEHTPNRSAWLVCRVLVNEHGHRLFGDEDAENLGKLFCVPLYRALAASLHLSGMTDSAYLSLQTNMKDRPERRLYFQLAENLHMTVRELLESSSARELAEWYAFYEWRASQPGANGKPTSQASQADMLRRLERKRGR